MDTETMIRELERVEEKHKHDKVFTGQLDVAQMAHDIRKRLEELKPYEDTGLDPEQIVELKERDTAKTPVISSMFYVCPACGCARSIRQKHKFCHECGQRIKWEE